MTVRLALRRLCQAVFAFAREARGATAVEYGLVVALIVIAMIAALKGVADANTNMWTQVSSKVQSAN
ncbi:MULTISPECIES: Flp family type IVb pilin [Sphingomonas]|jgi:pilus assembly protein Flp/PilA|uniref:Flp family type IVb pilin n=1 Tax=Sphingomonas TaxID=13687 RepID=UPI00193C3B5B|nr:MULTISPECIES: Flp family type IVb pilin [Sphingomonas]